MTIAHELHVLRVFCDETGGHGNPLGVFVDGHQIPRIDRQAIAARLGFSETVFVDDPVTGGVDIRTPTAELPFAGHPLVGTAWLLHQLGTPVGVLRPAAGEVPTWADPPNAVGVDAADGADATVWIRGRAAWAPPMTLRQHADAAAVDAVDAQANDVPFIDHWAWIDEAAGLVRCRVFAPAVGIVEDEATGAAATRLIAAIDRAVTIRQGRGSIIHARPGLDATVEVGGRVVLDEVRDDTGAH